MEKNSQNQLVNVLYKGSTRGAYNAWLKKYPKNANFQQKEVEIIKKIQFIILKNDNMERF